MFHSFTRGAFCVALAALCSSPALAAGANPAPSPSPSPTASPVTSTLPNIGRVSTSDRQDEPAGSTTRDTYVVTKSEILAHGYQTVGAALALVPGVDLAQYGALGALANVGIRGSSTSQVLVLLDGRPIVGAQTAGVDLGSISTTGVERIEIVEGGGSTLYGTGAIGGVINIITSKNPADYKVPLVTLRDGSYGDEQLSLETANFSFQNINATNNFPYPSLDGDPAGVRMDSQLQQTDARATIAKSLGVLSFNGSIGAQERHLGLPGDLAFGPVFSAQQDDSSEDVRGTLSYVRPHATATLDLSAERETLYDYDFDPRDADSFGAPTASFTTESELHASLRNVVVADDNRLIYGIDLGRGVAQNSATVTDFVTSGFAQTALFAQDSVLALPATRLSFGLRGERDGAFGGATTPSLGISQTVVPGIVLKSNFTNSFNVPTQEDLFYPGFSNPNLKPERATGYDVALFDANILGGISLGYFTSYGIDQIILNPAANPDLPYGPANEPLINAERTTTAGLTGTVTTLPYHHITTTINLTDTYRANDVTSTATRLPYVPVIAANVQLAYLPPSPYARFAGFGITARTVGNRFATDGLAPTYTTVGSYLKLRAASDAFVWLRVENLGNERYDDIAHYPVPGRTFALELSTH